MKIRTDLNRIKEEWDNGNVNDFIHSSFLEIFYSNHPKIKHIFVIDKGLRLYGHLFTLRFNKIANYLNNKLAVFLLQFLRFKILYLTNTFITNVPSFTSKDKIDINKLLALLKNNYDLLILPDFLYDNITTQKNDFFKIEVEEEMALQINKKWCSLEGYISDFKKKYKKKVEKILESSKEIEVRTINSEDLNNYSEKIQALFIQLINESKFNGPKFNTSSFSCLIKKDFFKLNGYFINNDLIAFASEIYQDKILYSYYVGFDKSLNETLSIYPRILLESINTAIKLKKEKVVFGRTANEFKSNFGAKPIQSYVYLHVRNRFLRILLLPIFKKLTIKKWQQRNPFK